MKWQHLILITNNNNNNITITIIITMCITFSYSSVQYLVFKQLYCTFHWSCSVCYKYHRFSLSLSEFLSNPDYPSTHTVRIADGLLCISAVAVSKYQLTQFKYIYRLLSTHYGVSSYEINKSLTTLQLYRFWLVEICWCVLKTTVVLFYSHTVMVYCGTK